MVWWINSDRYCVCSTNFFHCETAADLLNDRIFQKTNIMYNLANLTYDKYDILSLVKSGVNIFNVDRTIQTEDYFQKIKEVFIEYENMGYVFPIPYQSPVALAITITRNESDNIDESVDIIMLKEVTNLKELLELKEKVKNISVPLMLWIKSWTMEDLKPMIQYTDGVILDYDSSEEGSLYVIQLCKQAHKSVFFVLSDIINNYHSQTADDLHVLAIGNKITKHLVDGVMLVDNNIEDKKGSRLVQSLVRAMEVTENEGVRDLYKLIFTIKTPVLPWISAALAASLAAKQSGASIIIVLTKTGMSARWIANASPPCHIVAITNRKVIAKRLHLYRKVIPLVYKQTSVADWNQECRNRVDFGTTVALNEGLCVHGGTVVILAPSDYDSRYCNSLKIISLPLKCT